MVPHLRKLIETALRGEHCLDVADLPQPRQQIACTRSFGRAVTELAHLQEAIS